MKNHKENLEVSFADYGKDEMEIKGEFMGSCAMDDKLYVNTAGLSNKDTASMFAMQYMKMRPEILETGKGGLTDKQKKLPPALQKAILKRMEKKGELGEEVQKEAEELEATKIAVFPDKDIHADEVGTPYQDMRPINKDGYKIDEELKDKAKKEKLKNPGLQSVSPPQS